MTWLIIILSVVILLFARTIFNKKIDASEKKQTVQKPIPSSESSLWDALCVKFKSYLDFAIVSQGVNLRTLENKKGEKLVFKKDVTDIIVTYYLKGIEKKVWKFPFWLHVNNAYETIDVYYKSELQPKASISHVQEHWRLVEERPFTNEEINAVAKTKVVKSQYGSSVEFTMVKGGVSYIPMWDKDALPIGATLDMNKAKLMTLRKEGEKDLLRVSVPKHE